jgi:nucleoside-diphosphate-sugar epimerase
VWKAAAIALRFFSVWGDGQRPDLALETFRRRIEAGKPVVINGDGSQRRDLTHVADVKSVKLKKHLSHDLDGGGGTRGLGRSRE